ncbi:MAG: hypothetical protein ACXVCY_03635 [Pseudobdellovibrionaceae bacterium]
MIVLAWFCLVGFVILAGFVTLGLTFHHWYQQKKQSEKKAEQV